ncbi:uncharacterized protein PGTG_11042 [Puccinia graminis f. sp. tritici CRL 75-36-700-3]|uniref:Uncharacterized protein n=1 Tax=Puccinia graminis f. sp. tritici (strain CRL 75-36-700-3 / race SCCL) TaxID=418459 RepID=E3KN77_PUCGT|nr:uncharacterized protein PGTG_11042 [Puccinia graminis f. sp. tritici CRL 75-36-700-3]EFP85713.1 hypothetical protein PGTG_11042 [Puccinia graminis f. sp. tritici CRL 75-36-700-3]
MMAGRFIIFGLFGNAIDDLVPERFSSLGNVDLDDTINFNALNQYLAQQTPKDGPRAPNSNPSTSTQEAAPNAGHPSGQLGSEAQIRRIGEARLARTNDIQFLPAIQSHPAKFSTEAVLTPGMTYPVVPRTHQTLNQDSHRVDAKAQNPINKLLLEYSQPSRNRMNKETPGMNVIDHNTHIKNSHDPRRLELLKSSLKPIPARKDGRTAARLTSLTRPPLENQVSTSTSNRGFLNHPAYYDIYNAKHNMVELYQAGLDAYAEALEAAKKDEFIETIPTSTTSSSKLSQNNDPDHQHPSKTALPTLSFDKEIFTYEGVSGRHKKGLALFKQLIEEHPENEDRLVVPEGDMTRVQSLFSKSKVYQEENYNEPAEVRDANQMNVRRYSFTKEKNLEIISKQDLWYGYWANQMGRNVKSYINKFYSPAITELFANFLFYVEMITVVTLKPEGQTRDDYTSGINKACESFLEFASMISTPDQRGEGIHRYRVGEQRVLWWFLEFWLQHHHQRFWAGQSIRNRSGSLHIKLFFKQFFNEIFYCSIENFNKRYKDLIKTRPIINPNSV